MTRGPGGWIRTIAIAVATLAVAGVAGLAFGLSGVYDVAATRQHTAPVYAVLIASLQRSIKVHATREIGPPPSDLLETARVEAGAVLYDEHCVTCHGAPGVAPDALALGMTPPPSNLTQRGRTRSPRELYWAVAKGLKMTGMPGWEFRLSEAELWNVVAFVKSLPTISPTEYRGEPHGAHR